MQQRFIGRTAELSVLEREYQKDSSLVTVTGRSGTGKTSFLRRFSEGRNVLHFQASPLTESMLMDDLSKAVGRFYGGPASSDGTWKGIFDHFSGHSDNKKILIIEGFENLESSSKTFVQELKDSWDDMLSVRNVMLVISSSKPQLLDGAGEDRDHPLYGRISASVKLGPLSFGEFYDGEPYASAVERYAVCGGTPAYIPLTESVTAREAFMQSADDPYGMLVSGPLRTLSSEFKDGSAYISILRAIAAGNDRITQISSAVGVSATTLNAYLKRMQDMRLIRRDVPVTEYFPERSKSGSYSICDSNTAFWSRFILPHMSELMGGDTKAAVSDFDAYFHQDLVGRTFADICLGMMPSLTGHLGFLPLMTGRYWNRDVSIDILALNPGKRRAFIARAAFRNKGAVGREELESLMKDAQKVPELRGCVVKIGLFSVTGFDRSLYAETNVLLVNDGEVVIH